MAEYVQYLLARRQREATTALLLERGLAQGWRFVVRLEDDQTVRLFDRYLWTFRDQAFIPHSAKNDRWTPEQPVWLTHQIGDNPNNADSLILMGPQSPWEPNGADQGYARAIRICPQDPSVTQEAARMAETGWAVRVWVEDAKQKWVAGSVYRSDS